MAPLFDAWLSGPAPAALCVLRDETAEEWERVAVMQARTFDLCCDSLWLGTDGGSGRIDGKRI